MRSFSTWEVITVDHCVQKWSPNRCWERGTWKGKTIPNARDFTVATSKISPFETDFEAVLGICSPLFTWKFIEVPNYATFRMGFLSWDKFYGDQMGIIVCDKYYNGEIDGGNEASWPFKKLKQNGCFNYTWAARSTAVFEERKSDSCRLAGTSDLLVATPGAPTPEVWKKIILTTAHSAKSDDETEGRPTKMFQTLEAWLRLEIKTAGGDPTAALSKHVAEFLSVTPAISFVLAHGIPPQILQAKYILVVGKSGDVRVLWYGFITDKVMPGAVAGAGVAVHEEDAAADDDDEEEEEEGET
eukprot:jgi/Bigna1/145173/aug1.96_g19881